MSYLVFREIKTLEKKVRALEADLKEKEVAIEAANTVPRPPHPSPSSTAAPPARL